VEKVGVVQFDLAQLKAELQKQKAGLA